MASDALVGAEIGGFRIERLLGRSGSGDVYLAYELRLGRRVALKLLSPPLADDPAFRDRFVRLTVALEHPNVVPVYDAGDAAGVSYIAMRYIAGESLRERIRRDGRLDPQQALAIARQVAAALDAAHARRLVHRDVKPENILLDASGTAYLLDFFVAALAAGTTDAGRVVGSPPYMAPEVCRGEEVDERADLYALGCTLFECLAGTPPYRGEPMAMLHAHVYAEVPRITSAVRDLPDALDAVFETALAKDPDARHDSASALIDALARALGGRAAPIESGVVTFVFTDIEGSTRLLRRLRGGYPALVAEHQRLLREAFTRQGGREVDTQGDSTFVAFRTATDAVRAALAARRAVSAHEWPDGAEVRVRFGIHTGTASLTGDRYFGLAVHRAARIGAFGEGGQIVVSDTTRSLLEDEEEDLPGIELHGLGAHALKDFDRPVPLFEVVES